MNDKFKKIVVYIVIVTMVFTSAGFIYFTNAADDTVVKIKSFTTSLRAGADKKENGDYVWKADTNGADHRFTYRIRYELSGTREFEPEKVEIRIPKEILKDREGHFADYYDVSVPEYDDPDIDSSVSFVYKVDGDEIVIYNISELPAGANGFIEVSYLTSKRTTEYIDYGAENCESEPFYANIKVEQDEVVKTAETDPIPVNIDTGVTIQSTDKRSPYRYNSWNSSWGDELKPQNDDEYFYILWEIRTWINTATQRYDFKLEDRFSDTNNGMFLGYKLAGARTFSNDNIDENQCTYSSTDRYDYVLTAHKKDYYDELDEYEFKNFIRATVDPIDQVDEDTHATDSEVYKYKKQPPKVFNGGIISTDTEKWGYDYRDWHVYNSDDIRNFELDDLKNNKKDKISNLRYSVHQYGYVYPWTIRDGGDRLNPEDYGYKNVKFVLNDNTFKLMDEEEPLTKDDYQIDRISYTYNIKDADYSDEDKDFRSKTPEWKDTDKIDFYGEFNGAYEKIGTLNLKTKEVSNVSAKVSQFTPFDITFAEGVNCTGYRIETENNYYYTSLNANVYASLKNSDKVMNTVADLDKVWLRNTADFKILSDTGRTLMSNSRTGTDYIIGIIRDGHTEKDVVSYKNNKIKKNYTIGWNVTSWEDYLVTGGSRNYVNQSSGKFYDLAPIGGDVDLSSVKVYADGRQLLSGEYEVSTVENYKKSGRTMLLVKMNVPADKYNLRYNTVHSWDSIKDHGIHVRNSVAYETGNDDIGDGRPDDGGNYTDKELMTELNPDTNAEKFLYNQATHNIDIITAANLNLLKKVKAETDEEYSYETITYPDSKYSYQIRFATDEDSRARNLILFDSLENYVVKKNGEPDKTSDWHGTLQSVSTAQIEKLGCNPVVYYSKIENLDLDDHHDLNEEISGEKVWLTEEEIGDVSLAKAVAIDMRKKADDSEYILPADTSVTATIHMKSPKTVVSDKMKPIAYNNIYLNNTIISPIGTEEDFFVHQDYTQISYRVTGDLNIDKVSSEDRTVKASGIWFKLTGTSDYGTEESRMGVTQIDGSLRFEKLERGHYKLQEVSTTDDWLPNSKIYDVTVDNNGNVTVDGLEQYDTYDKTWTVVINEPRIHGDLNFKKKSIGQDNETIQAIQDIKNTPAENEVTIGEDIFFIMKKDEKNVFLWDKTSFLAHNPGEGSSSIAPYFYDFTEVRYLTDEQINNNDRSYVNSNIRKYLNNEYLETHPIISNIVVPTTIKTGCYDINSPGRMRIDEMSDYVFLPGLADNFKGKVHILGGYSPCFNSADNLLYPSKDNIAYTKEGLRIGLNTYYSGPTIRDVGLATRESDYQINWGNGWVSFYWNYADSEFEPKTIITNNDYKNYPVIYTPIMQIDISNSQPERNIPNTEFKLEGTSDYGNEVLEYATSNNRGDVNFNNLEKGTYTLTETKANPDYVLDKTKYTVTVNEEGVVSIENVEENSEGDLVLRNEAYHNFSLRKVDEQNGSWLEGAEFTLKGTDNYGKKVDMTETSNESGRATFDMLAAGSYVLKETNPPDKYVRDNKEYIVEIDKFGNVTIDGLTQDSDGMFEFKNERGQEGKIKIIKKWDDGLTGEDAENRETPEITISTKEPEKVNGISVTIKWKGDSAEDRPDDVTAHLVNAENKEIETSVKGKWTDNRDGTWTYDFKTLRNDNKNYYVYLDNVTGYNSDAKGVDNKKQVTEGNVNIENELITEAYAVFDNEDGSLVFFKDKVGKYTNETTEGTKIYYTGIENTNPNDYIYIPWYSKRSNIQSVRFDDVIKPISTAYWFYDMNNLIEIKEIERLNTSNVGTMHSMFSGCNNLINLDVSHFDTSKVTNMSRMFNECNNLTEVNVSKFNTSKVIGMGSMFYNCYNLTATLNIMNMPSVSMYMCKDTSKYNGQLTLKYVSPVTSADIDTLMAFKGEGNVVNGGEGVFVPPTPPSNIQSNQNSISPNFAPKAFGAMNGTKGGAKSLSNPKPATEGNTIKVTYKSGENGKFEDGSDTNEVEYKLIDSPTVKYSHTPNIDDEGNQNGTFDSYKNWNDVVTIPNASKLKINIKYNCYDNNYTRLNLYEGRFPLEQTQFGNNSNPAKIDTIGGSGEILKEYIINGNSITFDFHSEHFSYTENGYGYYAVVTGLDEDENVINHSKTIGDIVSGEYKKPIATNDYMRFEDWSIPPETIIEDTTITAKYNSTPSGKSYNLPWKISKDGTLFIGEEGKTINTNWGWFPRVAGWHCYRQDIKSIKILGNVVFDKYGEYLFSYMNLDKADLTGLTIKQYPDNLFEGTTIDTLDLRPLAIGSSPDNTTRVGYLFNNSHINKLYLPDTKNVTNFSNMFYGANINQIMNWENLKIENDNSKTFSSMFKNATIPIIDISSLQNNDVKNFSSMFQGYSGTIIGLDLLNTSNAITMSYMFNEAIVPNLNLLNFDTSNVTNMEEMFCATKLLNEQVLNLSSFNTSNVTNTKNIFRYYNNLQAIALGDKSIFSQDTTTSKWEQYATLSNKKIYDGNILNKISDYDGSAPGWYKLQGTTAPNESKMYSEYCTKDDESKWVKVDDDTWEYTFDVFDDEVDYYAWENMIPDGYVVDYDANNPVKTQDKKATITNKAMEQYQQEQADKLKKGNLEISKTVEGNLTEEDKDVAFPFDVELLPTGIDSVTKYSHTPNIDDEGNKNGNYSNNANQNEVITIEDAEKLHVEITYSGESTSYDWACVWEGKHPEYTAYNNYSSSVSGKLGGSPRTTKEYDIIGDSVTIGFRSDGSGVGDGYGYYAKITGEGRIDDSVFSGNHVINGVLFKDGKGTVYLKDGESFKIDELPRGTTYRVEERTNSDYPIQSEKVVEDQIVAGETKKAEFVNKKLTREEEDSGGFALTKKIEGTSGEYLDEFEFKVSFTGLKPTKNYEFSNGTAFTSDEDGTAEVELKLKHNDVVSINTLPLDAVYQITEIASDYKPSYEITEASDDWTKITKDRDVGSHNNSLSTAKEIVEEDEDINIVFTNSPMPFELPNTGGFGIWFIILIGIITIIISQKRRAGA